MTTNRFVQYFDQTNELALYKSLIEDSIQFSGIDVYYVPREATTDELWNDTDLSSFENAYEIEMYINDFEGFQGDGDVLSQLGLSVKDNLELIVHPDRFTKVTSMDRPLEGDLIYFGLTNTMFQIKFVEHESPWYQLAGITMLKLKCEVFQDNQEEFNTGVSPIDDIDDDKITDSLNDSNQNIESESNESNFDENNPFGSY